MSERDRLERLKKRDEEHRRVLDANNRKSSIHTLKRRCKKCGDVYCKCTPEMRAGAPTLEENERLKVD